MRKFIISGVLWCFSVGKFAYADTLTIVKKPINFGFVKPDTTRNPDVILIHSSYCNSLPDSFNLDCILQLYRKYRVGAHYIIDKKGMVYELIPEEWVAHHGGQGILPDGDNRINTRSIGIELINSKKSEYSVAQYKKLAILIAWIQQRHKIRFILGHADVAPERKSDPWNFDWQRLRETLRDINPSQIYIQHL